MENYFLAGLTSEQRNRVDAAGISYYDLTIGRNLGMVIEAGDLPRLLSCLDATVANKAETGYQGIVSVSLRTMPAVFVLGGRFRITASSQDYLDDNMVSLLTELLVPRVSRDIVLHCQRDLPASVDDGRFHVHIWHLSSQDGREKAGQRISDKLWGHALDSGRRYIRRSAVGGQGIFAPNCKAPVAELVGADSLCIHVDLVPAVGGEQRILREILERAVLLMLSPEELRERERLRFVENCAKSMVRALSLTDGDLVARKEKIKQLRKLIADETRLGEKDEKTLLSGRGLKQQSFGAEYEALLRVPKVKDVRVEGRSIIVLTDVLNCLDDRTGRLHEIGAFKITLPMNGASPNWKNLTRRVNAYNEGQQAPHVWADGSACLGNSKQLFADLFAQRQYAIAAQLAIEFVENANTSDPAGKGVSRWPLAKT